MIDHARFTKNMEKDPRYLFFLVSNTLEVIGSGIYMDFDKRVHDCYDWSNLNAVFADEFVAVARPTARTRRKAFYGQDQETPALTQWVSQYTRWAFELGYLTEASKCAEALRALGLWEENS